MIWRLTYCNKKGVEARVDIIKGDRTSVEIVQGSANPFTLSYKLDKNDKSGHIMTSSADIEIFETETFNIDDLKTSNETELKVEYFEGNILTWSGFILPDFFSREIGSPNIVRMTASDRLTALKGVTLSDLPIRVSLRDLIELSLAQTGLDLALVAQIQINQGSTNILDSEILSQRLTDTRGRSISCYNILMSIMVATNSTIRQREGQWVVYNKLEHELRTPTIFFDKVERGAIRTIQPVASSVGVYNEFGGGRSYPDNYDFSDGLTGWTAVNGFVAAIDNRKVDNFVSGTGVIPQEWTTNPVYGDATEKNYLVNDNYGIDYDFADKPYLKSSNIPVTYPSESQINVNVLVNATGPFIDSTEYRGETNFAVIASNGTKTLHLGASGAFEPLTGDPFLHKVTFDGDTHLQAVSSSKSVNGVLSVEEGNLSGYNITVRLYGYTKGVTGGRFLVTTLVNSVIVTFKTLSDAPKGNLYKTTQGSNFTKQHDIETVIFGDYIRKGLNGYFYDYPIDDSSNLYLPSGELASPTWITIFDTTERPLLHHISRQKSRLFSVAHDILRANINVESFDPLAVFQDCKGGKYIVVSARFDFLRSEVDVELEQIAYDNTILKRDFIYSYFGEGESNIKSIGGITGGGSGTGGGGGMTSEQLEMLTNLASWWKLDEDNDAIYSEKSVYSLKEVSAYGLGSQGGGSGGTTVTWGATVNNYSLLTVEGEAKNVALSGHKHAWSDLADLPDTLSGYGITDAYTKTQVDQLLDGLGVGTVTSVGMTVPTGLTISGSPITTSGTLALGLQSGYSIPTIAKQNNWDAAYTNTHTHSNKAQIDLITQAHINVLNKLFIDADGNVYTTENFYSTKEVSAYGLGSGGGPGGGIIETVYGYNNLGQTFNNATLTDTFNAYTINQINNRLLSVESGSATEVTTSGTGNAITSISKSGNVITATKGSTFSLSTHNHDTIYKPIGYVPSWGEITGKPSTFAPATHTHSNISITAGTGLSGGGALSASRTLSIASTYAPNTSTSLGASKNLNNYQTAGFYHQTANANATTALNYPVASAGSLLVQTAAGVIQTYKVYNSSNVYVRGYYNSAWSAWRKLALVTDNVASATKLQTARNINGTSFDGTAAITTANWGTARNIGIVNSDGTGTAVTTSVNGSANVNLKLPATIKATLSGNASSATNLSRSVVAGNGLTGGGVLNADRTLTLGTPSSITLSSTNSVTASSHTHNLALGGTASQYLNGATSLVTIPTITAGNGLSGGGQLTASRTLTLGTPSTLTKATTNGVTGTSHTHAITTTTVGAADTIVATDASGGVRGNIIRIGSNWTLELSGTELWFKYGGVVKQKMFQDGSFVATGEVAAYSQGVAADELQLNKLTLLQGGGDSKYLTSSATQIYFSIGGVTPLVMSKTEVRRGTSANNVNLGTSAYPWANIYGVNLIASTNLTTPKITLGNGWTIEQTSASLTIRRNGVVKGTFNA